MLQARGIAKSAVALRRGDIRPRRLGPWWRVGLTLFVSLLWAAVVLLLVPKQLGLPLSILATGFPDLVLLLTCSALAGLAWAVVKAVWTFTVVRAEQTVAVPAT